ncbi:MAG: histidinol phosphate phosphatase domain-containing protein [Elusimicrobiota bacterium]|jgi:histidinol phosphatase-like PHP family hydrolase|nr:histidinol phosphate phosphatase domain-containing protein [Elusimicrobiota bacterium]
MIDLHTHTFFSDGVLSPSELVYRAKCNGYKAIAITDHVDYSNMELVIPNIVKVTQILTKSYGIGVLAGAELTYVPPNLISLAAKECRKLGARVLVVHGETVAETVPAETNFYAVCADIDILAHPGHLTPQEAELAAKNDIKIEITTRRGHGVTNEEVAKTALSKNAKLVLNTDFHCPDNFLTSELIDQVLKDCHLPGDYYQTMKSNSLEIIKKYGGCSEF